MAGVSVETRAPDGKTLTAGIINIAASGAIIAAVAGQIIRVYKMFVLNTTGTTTIQFTDGTNNFTGVMTLATGTPLVLNFDGTPWFTSIAGGSFTATLGASTQVSGTIYFTQQ